jgi:hypothetical protein
LFLKKKVVCFNGIFPNVLDSANSNQPQRFYVQSKEQLIGVKKKDKLSIETFMNVPWWLKKLEGNWKKLKRRKKNTTRLEQKKDV